MCEKKRLLSVVIILICAIYLQTSTCFRLISINSSDRRSFQLDRTGWRTVNLSTGTSTSTTTKPPERDIYAADDDDDIIITNNQDKQNQQANYTTSLSRDSQPQTNSRDARKSPIPVQWDDDELSNDYQEESSRFGLKGQKVGGEELQHLEEPHDKKVERVKWLNERPKSDWSAGELADSPARKRKMLGKLVYHGRMAKNGSLKIIDGIKLHINTHRPVAINRRHFTATSATRRHLEDPSDFEDVKLLSKRNEVRPARAQAYAQEKPEIHQVEGDSSKSSSSEWKPIVLNSSSKCNVNCKAAAATKDRLSVGHAYNQVKTVNTSYKILDDSSIQTRVIAREKWKPIKVLTNEGSKKRQEVSDTSDDRDDRRESFLKPTMKPSEDRLQQTNYDNESERSDQEDGDLSYLRGSPVSGTRLLVNSEQANSKQQPDARWTPVDTTTETSASRESSSQSPGSSNGSAINSPDSAQKSASDLNYIYSPQQQQQQQQQQIPSRSEWLARSPAYGYGQQQMGYSMSGNEMPTVQLTGGGTIVDSNSGQLPEMVSERTPEAEVAQVQISQPVNRPTYSYEPSSYYAKPQQAPRVVPQTTIAPPVIRQEHHYHYYGQQQQQQQQQQNSDRQQQQQQQQTSQVIRELQPLFISQPQVIQQQQQPSTTAAPQIIREIIKEVPAPTMQIYVPPPPPPLASRVVIPAPPQPIRELDSGISYGQASYSLPAQRIIRQLSGNIPSAVVARIAPIRLPIQIPTIQIPTRLTNTPPGGGITRQTGSFIIPPVPQKTTTYLTETQAMPTHTTIMHTTQFTPATRTTVYTTDHQATPQALQAPAYRK